MNDTYTVLLREKKLPLSLLEDPDAKRESKQSRALMRKAKSFDGAFGKKQTRKRPKLATEDYAQLLGEAEQTNFRCTEDCRPFVVSKPIPIFMSHPYTWQLR